MKKFSYEIRNKKIKFKKNISLKNIFEIFQKLFFLDRLLVDIGISLAQQMFHRALLLV